VAVLLIVASVILVSSGYRGGGDGGRCPAKMSVERQLVDLTITSGVVDLSEKLQAIRDALPVRWPRSGHSGRVGASRLMTSIWWVVPGR
jgi:hypothetical protein